MILNGRGEDIFEGEQGFKRQDTRIKDTRTQETIFIL